MTASPDQVRMHAGYLWLLRLGCPLLGIAVGLTVKPLVRWTTRTLDSAPAPLRIAADIPTPWAIPILGILGAVAGYWLAQQAERDSLTVTVQPDHLITTHHDRERYIQRAQVSSAFTDPKDLVLLDAEGRELFRAPTTDLPKDQLADALRRHHYPWRGTRDPHEDEYRRWIDGHPDLDEQNHVLLRARHTALRSKNRDEAERIRTQLQDHGIVVRDRGKQQQYRPLTNRNNGM